MARACPHCHRTLQGSRGVMRHVRFCGGGTDIPRWRYRHEEQDYNHGRLNSSDHGYQSTTSPPVREDAGASGLGQDLVLIAPNNDLDVGCDTPDFDGHSRLGLTPDRAGYSSRMTMSSGAVTVVDTYFRVEGGLLPPGYGYSIDDSEEALSTYPSKGIPTPLREPLPIQPLDQLDTSWFYPFRSLAEYELCSWLFRDRTTAGSMKDFFETSMGPWRQLTDITSVPAWKQALHQIPYGILDDTILECDITMEDPQTRRRLKYVVRYRSILAIIRFLIGHIPFKSNLVYAPVRLFKDEERNIPIWNEMHTGSWWWDQQKSLPSGSTLVPILLASDKTQLTQHHGDKASHPVYVTIGNLDKQTRRSQKRPSKVLLGFLPIVGRSDHRVVGYESYEFKRYIFNTSMEIMTRELQRLQTEGVRLVCADGMARHCFPVIGGFMMDYEEQALITGVKNGQHCVQCRIPPDQREYMTPLERYPLRTHHYTQQRIRLQRDRKGRRKRTRDGVETGSRSGVRDDLIHDGDNPRDESMDIADVRSFMWSFQKVNIHEIMHVDILHQCLKGIVHRALKDWVYVALRNKYGEARTDALLDERFRIVPRFPGLKTFSQFSAISQWTGVEQKAMLRQLVPVLAPLVSDGIIQFFRALVDFTLHAQYFSHDSDTILWMEAAIERMNIFKEVFRDVTAPGTGFNIPKLHAITHFPMMIRKFGTPDGYDTAMFEALHKHLVKGWYQLTNKRETFEMQIFEHNQRAHNMSAMQDLMEFRVQETLELGSKDVPAQVTAATKALNFDELGWSLSGTTETNTLRTWIKRVPSRSISPHLRANISHWRQASTVAGFVTLPYLLDALAVFVREERKRHSKMASSNIAINKMESDSSWIDNYPVCLHPSLSCWKADRDDGTNADTRLRELVRCDPDWQGKGEWRRDSVWVQEYPGGKESRHPLQGRLPSRLQLIVSVLDIGAVNDTDQERIPIYTGALLDVYSLRNRGRQNLKHGMIEAQRHPPTVDKDHRSLGHQRFYHLGLILRSVHLVPESDEEGVIFYINPFVDWDQYVTVFDKDFLRNDEQVMRRIGKSHGWLKKISEYESAHQ